jgi:hypothetical protein
MTSTTLAGFTSANIAEVEAASKASARHDACGGLWGARHLQRFKH